jgi:hypothetical protein
MGVVRPGPQEVGDLGAVYNELVSSMKNRMNKVAGGVSANTQPAASRRVFDINQGSKIRTRYVELSSPYSSEFFVLGVHGFSVGEDWILG